MSVISGLKSTENGFGEQMRSQFPIFAATGCAKPLAYLDSAASSQKPLCVIERLQAYLSAEHANIHRGAYALSANSTRMYEETREKLAKFIGAQSERSIIFTRGATESVNLVSYSLEDLFNAGDSLLISTLEHHSNIVPWQLLGGRKQLNIVFADVTDQVLIDYDDLEDKLKTYKPKLFAVTMLSNAIGSLVDIKKVVELCHSYNCLVVVDSAQAAAHIPINVQELDVDFMVFSGHKFYGPTGSGVLYVKPEMYELMSPFHGGGDMIREVTVEGSTWADPPQKFEAGTPPIAEIIALGAAVDFLESIDWSDLHAHERELFKYAYECLSAVSGLKIYGPGFESGLQKSIISFTIENVHPHDLATIADSFNVQIRAGHHCAMPLLKRLGVESTARMSLGVYSTKADIDQLLLSIEKAQAILL